MVSIEPASRRPYITGNTMGLGCRTRVVGLLLGASLHLLRANTLSFVPAQFPDEEQLIVAAPGNPAIDAPPFLTPRGAGLDGVGSLILHRTDGLFLCSGSLVGANWMLTAAHCLADSSGNMVTSSVDATFFPNPSGTLTITSTGASNFFVNPLYNGAVGSDYDIALVRLPTAPGPGVDIYSFYTGPITNAQFTMVGFGARGDGSTGATLSAGSRRQGFNTFDFFNSPGVLISDFDNGNPANDASCSVGGPCNLGLGALESSPAPGDSGGPVFFGNQIVAIMAFGARTSAPPDIDGVLNSSFGEFGGYTAVAFNHGFLDATMAPEPSSWALLALGVATLVWRRSVQSSNKSRTRIGASSSLQLAESSIPYSRVTPSSVIHCR